MSSWLITYCNDQNIKILIISKFPLIIFISNGMECAILKETNIK